MMLLHALTRRLPRFHAHAVRAFAADAASSSDAADVAEFREAVRDFATREVAPHAAAIDASNSFPKDVNLWKKMGDFGLLGEREGQGCGGARV